MPNCYTCGSELNEWSESKGHTGQCRYCCAHYHRMRYIDPLIKLKQQARVKAMTAIKSGLIFKHNCVCGSEGTEMHHPDYNQPLEVIWQCKACHYAFHVIERKALSLANSS